MKDRIPALIATFMLLGLVALTWWAADYAERTFAVTPEAPINEDPDAWSGPFIMLQSNTEGIPITRLDGEYMRHYPLDDSYEVGSPELISKRPDSPRVIASSNIAYGYNNFKLIHMLGDGHVHRFPHEETRALDITSEKLVVHPDEDIIETDEPAVVIQGDSRLVGDGMKYNNQTRKLDVYSNTGVRIAPEDAP